MKLHKTDSERYGGAVQISMKRIGELGDACTEREMACFSKLMHTDLALKFTPPRLVAFSVKVEEGDRTC